MTEMRVSSDYMLPSVMARSVLPFQIVWTNPEVPLGAEPPIEQLPRTKPSAKSKLLRHFVYVNEGECCYLPPTYRKKSGDFSLCVFKGLVCLPY